MHGCRIDGNVDRIAEADIEAFAEQAGDVVALAIEFGIDFRAGAFNQFDAAFDAGLGGADMFGPHAVDEVAAAELADIGMGGQRQAETLGRAEDAFLNAAGEPMKPATKRLAGLS